MPTEPTEPNSDIPAVNLDLVPDLVLLDELFSRWEAKKGTAAVVLIARAEDDGWFTRKAGFSTTCIGMLEVFSLELKTQFLPTSEDES